MFLQYFTILIGECKQLITLLIKFWGRNDLINEVCFVLCTLINFLHRGRISEVLFRALLIFQEDFSCLPLVHFRFFFCHFDFISPIFNFSHHMKNVWVPRCEREKKTEEKYRVYSCAMLKFSVIYRHIFAFALTKTLLV